MAKVNNSKNVSDRNRAKEIEKLQNQFRDMMSSELKSLQGESSDRQDELSKLHNHFLQLVRQDTQNVNRQKSPNQSTYNYIASALTGHRNIPAQKDSVSDAELKRQLEKLFAGGDSEISSYFMNNGLDNMHIYDEIDSICAYMYQLDEAIDTIRDNVLASEQVSEGISMDIKFEGMTDEETTDYKQTIKDMFRNEGLTRKLKSHVIKKAVKYGIDYIMIIPYSDTSDKLQNIRGGFGMTENVSLFESAETGKESEYTLESALEDVAKILDIDKKDGKNGEKEEKDNQFLFETISNNLKTITVCENSEPPNISGFSYSKMANMDEHIFKEVTKAMKDAHKDMNQTVGKKGTKEHADGLIDKNALDGIKGCYIKIVDPRQMRPIKIFDYTIGYYYLENYDYSSMGTTLTDLMSNTMHFDQKTQTVDRLVDSVLGKLKYGDVLAGDNQFRSLILNCLLYAERRDNPVRIKFVSNEYVIPYQTNMDENGNGQPVLLRSLFFARLYISLLLFYITAIVTKSTDSEFYYLRENSLDPRYENQVTDVMDQLQQCNVDPISIAQGQLLNSTKAINKRYFMSLGTSGEKAFDVDVMSGQQIDINTEFLTDIKKMAISSTGVPSVMIDMVDEIEYATMASMANIKNLRRCNTIQEDFNTPLTQTARLTAKYTTNIPQEVIDKMYITLRPSKTIQNNISSNQVNDVVGIADAMVKAWYRGDESGEASEFDKRVMDKVRKAIIIELSPSAPWEKLDGIINIAKLSVRQDMERDKVLKSNESGDGDSSGDGY